jgi:hypothetical protein
MKLLARRKRLELVAGVVVAIWLLATRLFKKEVSGWFKEVFEEATQFVEEGERDGSCQAT